jgi:hypothetical protein
MSSARQGLTIVGQAVGAYFGGPIGASIGGIIGGEIGGFIDGPPEGPKLEDLSAPQVEFGGKIARLYGGPKWIALSPRWMSEKREESEVVGGKGGDSGQEQFSYRVDMLGCLTESREGTPCEVIAITGVEIDGQLAWTALADAGEEGLANSADQEDWSTMTLLTGSETQSPWSVYEAAVGAADANAYRGYATVGFQNLLLGQNGMPRHIRVQIITSGTPSTVVSSDPPEVVGSTQGTGTTGSLPADTASGDASVFCVHAVNGTVAMDTAAYTAIDNRPTSGGGSRLWVFGRTLDGTSADSELSFTCTGGTVGHWGVVVVRAEDDAAFLNSAQSCNFSLDGSVSSGGITKPSGAYQFAIAAAWVDTTAPGAATLEAPPDGYTEYAHGEWGWDVLGTPVASEMTLAYKIVTGLSENPGEFDDGAGSYGGGGVGVMTMMFTAASAIEYGAWTPTPVLLRDILEYEAGERSPPLTAADIDFSATAGHEVDCHVGVGSAAEVMQPLLTRFWFDLFSADKLYTARRGGSVEQTIPFAWSGAGAGQGFAGLKRANDVEVPKKKAVTYANLLADGETDTRTGDRESPGSDVETMQMNLHMVPTEAQGLADTATADKRVGEHTATIKVGARHGMLLQPGSVANFVDHLGNTYRCLVIRIVWDRWEWELDVRLDDPQVLAAAGIAVDLDQRALVVAPQPVPTLYVLDIPLLRAADDSAGEYVAVTCTGRWRGATLYKSSDDVTYTNAGEVVNKATAGVCDTELPAFTGWGWDNGSTLTVTLDEGAGGTLSSATKAAIEADRSLNLAAIGVHGRWELVQFATATLTTGTTYTLSGFLRNLFGTEWANADHAAADSFVLLTPALGRISGTVADLGQTRYYKAVPKGRSIGGVTAESITCEEQCLLPYAPVDVRNDAGTVKWNRRSRLAGAVGIDPPIGEASERYDAETYSGVTLDDSEYGLTVAEWAASSPSGKTAKVYQLSELVGRGHEAEAVLT